MSKLEKVPDPTTAEPPQASVTAEAEPAAAKPESALKSLIAGGVGGACCVLTGHPLDLIKVRMQAGGASGSVFGILRGTIAKEGFFGLYRGVAAPITAVSPIFALNFWGYNIGQRIVKYVKVARTGKKEAAADPLTMGEICIAGGISAIPATALMAPSERVKCLLQVQTKGGEKLYNGMIDCAIKVLRTGGIQSLYKGTTLTLMRDVPATIAWFGTYEIVKKQLMLLQGLDPQTGKLSPLAVITAGGLAGMACWSVAIPSDVLKSIYQTAPEGAYTGVYDVYSKLVAAEGHGALVRGIRPAMIRAFPANAACFLGMETARKFLAFMD